MQQLTVTARVMSRRKDFVVRGRLAETLLDLVDAGEDGLFLGDKPDMRWINNMDALKQNYQLKIALQFGRVDSGSFRERYTRFVLRSRVEIRHYKGKWKKAISIKSGFTIN